MKTSTPVCKAYGTHLFGYVVDFSSVTYAKSTRLPQINPVAENLRTVRLTMSHLRYRQNHIKGVSNVSYVREGLIDIRRKTEYVTFFLSSLCLV